MSETIWKFPLEITDEQTLAIPRAADLLTVQVQRGRAFLWANVRTDNPTEERIIIMRGTGHALTGVEGKYLGTIQLDCGYLVFHVFDGDWMTFYRREHDDD